MKKRVFMIHGYSGKPQEGWRPWLKKQLEEKGMEVHIPAMPDTDHPRVGPWVAAIQKEVGEPNKECIFIGHSLGCIAILRYLETLTEGQKIGQAILIAGFYEDLGPRYTELLSFVDTPVNWEAIHSHCSNFQMIHSDDDTAVPVHFAHSLAEKLQVPLELHHGYKHFGAADNILELPFILKNFI